MKTNYNFKLKLLLILAITSQFLAGAKLNAQDVKQTEANMMKQADENIEKYRKGDVIIQFKTRDGKMIQNAKVDVHQKSSDFMFGCIIFDLIGNENTYK